MRVEEDTNIIVENIQRRRPAKVGTHTQYDPLLPSSDILELANTV